MVREEHGDGRKDRGSERIEKSMEMGEKIEAVKE